MRACARKLKNRSSRDAQQFFKRYCRRCHHRCYWPHCRPRCRMAGLFAGITRTRYQSGCPRPGITITPVLTNMNIFMYGETCDTIVVGRSVWHDFRKISDDHFILTKDISYSRHKIRLQYWLNDFHAKLYFLLDLTYRTVPLTVRTEMLQYLNGSQFLQGEIFSINTNEINQMTFLSIQILIISEIYLQMRIFYSIKYANVGKNYI